MRDYGEVHTCEALKEANRRRDENNPITVLRRPYSPQWITRVSGWPEAMLTFDVAFCPFCGQVLTVPDLDAVVTAPQSSWAWLASFLSARVPSTPAVGQRPLLEWIERIREVFP